MSHAKTQSRKGEEILSFFASLRLCVRNHSFPISRFVPKKTRTLGIVSLSLLFSVGTIAFGEPILSEAWAPDLNLVVKHLQKELSEASAQQSINSLSGRLAEVRDAQLAIVYVQLWQKLESSAHIALGNEQADWIKKRELQTSEILKSNEGGSAGPSEANCEFIKITESRIKELSERLKNLPNHSTK